MNIKKSYPLFILLLLLSSVVLLTGCFTRDKGDPHTEVRSMVYDGITRSYRVHIPPDVNTFTALVLVLHGGGGTGKHTEQELTQYDFNRLSEEHGFIVVYPDGIENRWNDGRTENNPVTDVDDVGFLTTLIDSLTEEFSIDTNNVFSTGISNGGQMSYRLACERTEYFKAIAPVVSALHEGLFTYCTPLHPLSVFIIAGTDDPLVPYNGGPITFLNRTYGAVRSMNETVQFWVTHNNCTKTPLISELPDIDPKNGCIVTTYEYANGLGNTTVLFYSINGGGHTWPSGGKYLTESLVGRICYDFNACEHIWAFFEHHLNLNEGNR
jgi:polyhydroxybutyrate depolymerase